MSVTFSAGSMRDHDEFGEVLWVDAPEDVEVNMSNVNAARVSETLGIGLAPDWCGRMPAEDFLGRVLVALAVTPVDAGVPAHEVPGPGARFIECGRSEGYLQERLSQLHDLAQWAIDNDKIISWG